VLHDGEPLRPVTPPPVLGQENDERDGLVARWNAPAEDVAAS
jgi:hypothetical protein